MRFHVLAGLLAASALGCHATKPAPPPPVPAVLTTKVHATPEPPLARRGRVASDGRLKLGFAVPGVIASLNVRTGTVVKKGQVLARLKSGDASATLRSAQVARGQALHNARSADTLAASGSLPSGQVVDANAALQLANANVALASESVAHRKLVAPESGTILRRLAEPGEAVAPGTPVVVLENTKRMIIETGITERELARVKEGQQATLMLEGGAPLSAVVTSIAPAPLGDGLYAVELTPTAVPEGSALRPGTLLEVHFLDTSGAREVRIPLDAIVHRDDADWALVVRPAADATKVEMRKLDLVRVDGKDVVVRAGLTEGDQIVREGGFFLRDGQIVRVLEGKTS
jgi:RND family efflux transporter MFP subunit